MELGRVLAASERARVVFTRERDTTVELDERYRIANAAGAALFVSIHANASLNTDLRGVETYLLSRTAADRRLKTLAERENEGRAIPGAKDDDLLAVILDGLELNAAHVGGQRLAMRVQDALEASVDTRGRGVLQAPFIVLLGAQMPAVLIEIGFVTNADECQQLATAAYQQTIARTLAGAILEHLAADPFGSARQ
jgi:N-acetylmuramoyl-L-alanine amidase